jgi:hypothetical protein
MYTSPLTNVSYYFNNSGGGQSFSEAEASCLENGGHLAAYASLDEQLEVERYFIDYGWWAPYYQKVGASRSAAASRISPCLWHGLAQQVLCCQSPAAASTNHHPLRPSRAGILDGLQG